LCRGAAPRDEPLGKQMNDADPIEPNLDQPLGEFECLVF
jgi:hypothetical protein